MLEFSLPSYASVYAIQDLSDAVNLGAPNRDIVMWPFKTTNMDEVYSRAVAANVEMLSTLSDVQSPFLRYKGVRPSLYIRD